MAKILKKIGISGVTLVEGVHYPIFPKDGRHKNTTLQVVESVSHNLPQFPKEFTNAAENVQKISVTAVRATQKQLNEMSTTPGLIIKFSAPLWLNYLYTVRIFYEIIEPSSGVVFCETKIHRNVLKKLFLEHLQHQVHSKTQKTQEEYQRNQLAMYQQQINKLKKERSSNEEMLLFTQLSNQKPDEQQSAFNNPNALTLTTRGEEFLETDVLALSDLYDYDGEGESDLTINKNKENDDEISVVTHMYTHNGAQGAHKWVPCLDILHNPCNWDFEITTTNKETVITPGRLVKTVLSEKFGGKMKTTFTSTEKHFLCPQNICLVVGRFKMITHTNLPFFTAFYIPFDFEPETAVNKNVKGSNENENSEKKLKNKSEKDLFSYYKNKMTERLGNIHYTVCQFEKYFRFVNEYIGVPYAEIAQEFKLVFTGHSTTQQTILESRINSFANVGYVPNELMLEKSVIENTREKQIQLCTLVSSQWFGSYVVPDTWSDFWLTYGLAGFIALQFFADEFGKNEYKHYVVKQSKRLHYLEATLDAKPLFFENYVHPVEVLTYNMFIKAPLIFHMVATWAGIRNIVKAAVNDVQNDATIWKISKYLSTVTFFVQIEKKFAAKDLRDFLNFWIYSTGVPRFICGCQFDAGTSKVLFGIKQVLSPNGPMPVESQNFSSTCCESSSFMPSLVTDSEELENTFSFFANRESMENAKSAFERVMPPKLLTPNSTGDTAQEKSKAAVAAEHCTQTLVKSLLETQKESILSAKIKKKIKSPWFKGRLHVFVHETEGAYRSDVLVDDEYNSSNYDCRTKHKKKQKKKLKEEQQQQSLNLTKEQDFEKSRIEIPIKFIRVDPELEWIRVVEFNQNEQMWVNQLEKEKDVIGQCEAIEALVRRNQTEGTNFIAEPLSKEILQKLENVLNDNKIYFRVRETAARALCYYLDPHTKAMAFDSVLKFFKRRFFDERLILVKPNAFHNNIVEYYIQRDLPVILSQALDSNYETPSEIINLLFDLLKYYDDSQNVVFTGNYYRANILRAIGKCVTRDAETILVMVKHLKTALIMDEIIPSSNRIVSIQSLRSLTEIFVRSRIMYEALQNKKRIETDRLKKQQQDGNKESATTIIDLATSEKQKDNLTVPNDNDISMSELETEEELLEEEITQVADSKPVLDIPTIIWELFVSLSLKNALWLRITALDAMLYIFSTATSLPAFSFFNPTSESEKTQTSTTSQNLPQVSFDWIFGNILNDILFNPKETPRFKYWVMKTVTKYVMKVSHNITSKLFFEFEKNAKKQIRKMKKDSRIEPNAAIEIPESIPEVVMRKFSVMEKFLFEIRSNGSGKVDVSRVYLMDLWSYFFNQKEIHGDPIMQQAWLRFIESVWGPNLPNCLRGHPSEEGAPISVEDEEQEKEKEFSTPLECNLFQDIPESKRLVSLHKKSNHMHIKVSTIAGTNTRADIFEIPDGTQSSKSSKKRKHPAQHEKSKDKITKNPDTPFPPAKKQKTTTAIEYTTTNLENNKKDSDTKTRDSASASKKEIPEALAQPGFNF